MIMIKGPAYDKLKYLAQVVLPALGTLYFALAGIWNLPSAEQVIGTIIAVDTFLGVVLHLSSNAYAKSDERFDGQMEVTTIGDKKTFQMAFNDRDQLETLAGKKEIRFKVNHM